MIFNKFIIIQTFEERKKSNITRDVRVHVHVHTFYDQKINQSMLFLRQQSL